MTSTSGGDDHSDRHFCLSAEMNQYGRHYGPYSVSDLMIRHRITTQTIKISASHGVWLTQRRMTLTMVRQFAIQREITRMEILPREPKDGM